MERTRRPEEPGLPNGRYVARPCSRIIRTKRRGQVDFFFDPFDVESLDFPEEDSEDDSLFEADSLLAPFPPLESPSLLLALLLLFLLSVA